MTKVTKVVLFFTVYMVLFAYPVFAKSSDITGFVFTNVYPYIGDVDDDAHTTVNARAILPNRFEYFGFVNLYNKSNTRRRSLGYFSEQNIRWRVNDNLPFDLAFQANFRTGDSNDRYRLGLRWRLNDSEWLSSIMDAIDLRYAITFYPIQFDRLEGAAWQIEHSFAMKFPSIDESLYLAGFIDHNFDEPLPNSIPDAPIVAEAQLGLEFAPHWYLVTEYRINQYRRNSVNNLAIGIEYKHFF